MKTCRLVVARFNEDTSWTQLVRKPWQTVIVQKGRDLENEGREASSFLWAIQEFYSDYGWLAFAQGNPFDHAIVHKILRPVTKFTWLGDSRYVSNEDGSPWHPGLPVKEFCEQHIGPWPGPVRFAAGGQFIVPADLIRTRPREFYAELQQAVCEEPAGPWCMERLWQVLFQGVSRSVSTVPGGTAAASPHDSASPASTERAAA